VQVRGVNHRGRNLAPHRRKSGQAGTRINAALFTREGGFQLVNGRSDSELPASVNCLINPGAVGQARGAAPLASYAVLDMERRRVSFREAAYDYRATIRKLRAAKLVAQVTLEPPRGVWRQVEKYKARWARYWAERQ